MRRDLKELGLLCAAYGKEKLINVLVINQQLNSIDHPIAAKLQISENPSEPRTIKDILQPPTMPQSSKPKTKRNLKVGFGVVTSDDVLQEVEEQEIAEAQREIERKEVKIDKN